MSHGDVDEGGDGDGGGGDGLGGGGDGLGGGGLGGGLCLDRMYSNSGYAAWQAVTVGFVTQYGQVSQFSVQSVTLVAMTAQNQPGFVINIEATQSSLSSHLSTQHSSKLLPSA